MIYLCATMKIASCIHYIIFSLPGRQLAKLEKIGLSWTEVAFMQVFVSNMADFGVVNGAYKGFFGINPPPRACVGANLPKPCRIQVSCTAIRRGAIPTKPRQTLHVQGMSYWAPANIGPYSQATEVSALVIFVNSQVSEHLISQWLLICTCFAVAPIASVSFVYCWTDRYDPFDIGSTHATFIG